MNDFLHKRYSVEPQNKTPEVPLRVVFFKFYDKKIASGELVFSNLHIDKDAFICLSTAQDPEMSKEDILNLALSMKLKITEIDEMMLAAGYELLEEE